MTNQLLTKIQNQSKLLCEGCGGSGYTQDYTPFTFIDDKEECHSCSGTGKAQASIPDLLMGVNSELCKAWEAWKEGGEGKRADFERYEREHPVYDLPKTSYGIHIKNTFEHHLASAVVGLVEIAGYLEIKIFWMESNQCTHKDIGEELIGRISGISRMATFKEYYDRKVDEEQTARALSWEIRRIMRFGENNSIPLEKHIEALLSYQAEIRIKEEGR